MQSGKVVPEYPIPPVEMVNFAKRIEEFKHHSTMALTMLLMNAQLITLDHGGSYKVKDRSQLGLFFVLSG